MSYKDGSTRAEPVSSVMSADEMTQIINVMKHPPPYYVCTNGREGRYCSYCFGNFPSTSDLKNTNTEDNVDDNLDFDSSSYKFMDSPTFLTQIDEFEKKDRLLKRSEASSAITDIDRRLNLG